MGKGEAVRPTHLPHTPPSLPASRWRRPAVQGPAFTDRPRGHLRAIVSPPPGDASFLPEEKTKPWKRDADLDPQNRHCIRGDRGKGSSAEGSNCPGEGPRWGHDPGPGREASVPALVSATPREVPVPSPALTSDAQTPRTLTVASWTENPAAFVLPWGLDCDRRGLSPGCLFL